MIHSWLFAPIAVYDRRGIRVRLPRAAYGCALQISVILARKLSLYPFFVSSDRPNSVVLAYAVAYRALTAFSSCCTTLTMPFA